MLKAIPRHCFPRSIPLFGRLASWNFSIYENDVEVAGLEAPPSLCRRWRLRIAFNSYDLYRQGWFSGLFLLEDNRTILARASRPSLFHRRYEIVHNHRTFRLTAQSSLTRAYSVFDGTSEIGSICPDHGVTRRATIDLPNDIVLPVKVFLFWLVVLRWRRSSHHSSDFDD